MTITELIDSADYYRDLIHKKMPFEVKQSEGIDNYFRAEFIYNSRFVDRSTLTKDEAKNFMETGITVSGKSAADYARLTGLAQAFDYMLSVAREKQLMITEEVIKRLHFLCYQKLSPEEAGHYRTTQAESEGMRHLPPAAEEVAHFMEHFMNQLQSSRNLMHPLEYATICHKRLIDISPFKEGNGMIAELILNLVLINAGYGIVMIPPELQEKYVGALVLAQRKSNPDVDALLELFAKRVIESEIDYCRLLKINE